MCDTEICMISTLLQKIKFELCGWWWWWVNIRQRDYHHPLSKWLSHWTSTFDRNFKRNFTPAVIRNRPNIQIRVHEESPAFCDGPRRIHSHVLGTSMKIFFSTWDVSLYQKIGKYISTSNQNYTKLVPFGLRAPMSRPRSWARRELSVATLLKSNSICWPRCSEQQMLAIFGKCSAFQKGKKIINLLHPPWSWQSGSFKLTKDPGDYFGKSCRLSALTQPATVVCRNV